jgi:hypothetical protein
MTIIKYVGLTAEASALIESRRTRPDQAEWEIIVEALKPAAAPTRAMLDLGQGVKLYAGERLYLFLDVQSKKAEKPHGMVEVGANADGIYLDGEKVRPSHGSSLQPAMRYFQERAEHVNEAGDFVSLSAWRQWHVLRDGRFVPLVELKDPALARRRGRQPVDVDKLFAELDALAPSPARN